MPSFLQKIIDKSPFLTKVFYIIDLYGSRRMGRSAAAFAYYLMLSFFPLLICIASIIGRTSVDTQELLELLSEVIPRQVTETLVTFFGYIHDNYSQAMLWAGIILLLTAASGAFGTIMVTMGDLYGEPRYKGLLHTAMSFLYSAVFLVGIYLSVVVVATGDWFIDLLDRWFHVGDMLASWTWLRFVLLTGIIMLLLLLLYRSVTPVNRPALPVLPGAVVGGFSILVVSIVFSTMISASARYTLVYGSLASLIILMLWLHLMGTIILIGGLVNLLYWQHHCDKEKR